MLPAVRLPAVRLLCAVSLSLLAAVPAAEAAKRPLPDLRVTATAAAVPTVKPGDGVVVKVTLRNEGRARAAATTTRISLGASGKAFAKGDVTLAAIRQPAVGRGRRASAKATLTVPAGSAAKRSVLACADSAGKVRESAEGDNCVLVARVAGGPAAAPVTGAGAPPQAALAKPSPAAPAAPAPAPAPGASKPDPATHCISHTGPQTPGDLGDWDSKLAPSSKVTFWWPKSRPTLKATATSLAQEMDQTIAPKLTQLMGRTPPSDGGLDCAHGAGGGVDVYLVDVIDKPWNTTVDPGAKGWTSVYTCNKNAPNPSYIHLADWSRETLAHEYFHVLQNAFADKAGCDRPSWLEEGTAEWAVEFTYKHSLTDDQSAQWLQAYEPALNDPKKTYDAWPFWYDVQKQVGAEAIPATFAALEYTDPLTATDQAIGTFRARWPEFARDAYNRDPVKTFATDAWTKTTWKVEKGASLLSLLSSESTKDVPYPGSQAIKPLARTYDDYAFTDRIRKITISALPTAPDYKLQGLLHMADGSWQERDLTAGATFCRDKPEQDVQEIVLIASNASVTTPVQSSSKLTVESACDLPHFKVISASFSNTTTGGMSGGNQPCSTGAGGTEDYGGHLASPLSDPDLKLSRRWNGDLEANLFFDVDSDGTAQLAGCTDPFGAELPCLKTRPNGKVDHKESIGFRVDVDHTKPTVATLHWLIEEASIGFFDADDSVCNVDEFYNHVTDAERDKQIPFDQLQHGTHTFTNSGTMSWKVDQKTGYPADLTLNWSYTVTLQVVDADGNPIP